MEKQCIAVLGITEMLEKSNIPLSPAVKAGGFVFVSGMPPIDRDTGELIQGDIAAQTEQVLENLKACLEAAGSSLDKVVKCTVYAANSGYFAAINEVYARYFRHDPPARTFAAVGSWPMPFDIEIECVAIA
ncbi:MAG: Rid family detoxifying hydrolase [Alphaproteobacteria bacterium]|jgi:reactive intermediate/imine deaminase